MPGVLSVERGEERAMPVADLAAVLDIERVPLSQRKIPATTYEMLKEGAALAPDSPALSFFAEVRRFKKATVWTHRELFTRITQAGNLFRRLGVEHGDAVAFVLPNLPETHLTIWGGEAAGIAFAISPLLETEQIAALLKAAEPKLLVTLAPMPGTDLWQKATQAAAGLSRLRAVLLVDMAPYVSAPKKLALRVLASRWRTALNVPVLDFRRELRKERSDALSFEAPKPDAVSSYFCTGGTTGSPKIARRTQFSEAFDAWAMTRFCEGRFGPGKTIFCGLPLFHVNGQLVTGLAPWSMGAHVVMGTPQGYRGEGVIPNFWRLVEHFRINTFSGVPTVYSALLQAPHKGRNIGSLEVGFCGAAPMPVQLFESFQEQTGVRIVEAYGLTEGACASSSNPIDAPPRVGSIGLRYPYQDMRALILDGENRYLRDAETGEIGAIAIRGPNVFAGYLDPAHNKGIWIERQGDVWLNTGDLGRQDADGYFWLTGRTKELIIRSGHNIDPKLIEEPLHRHPGVALVAAIGRPDAHAGEVPVAYVQLKSGDLASPAELLAFATRNIPERAAWPKAIRIVDKIPTTNVGKIFKPDLQKLEIEDIVRAEAMAAKATLAKIVFRQDPARGLMASVQVSRGHAELSKSLAKYAFAFEITS
ncbi:MAG TPA: acyl-CoA synthetase [Terracidiphilus sp.]|nr:acyl-CoA synthetase [Terracidiphilus sp.]